MTSVLDKQRVAELLPKAVSLFEDLRDLSSPDIEARLQAMTLTAPELCTIVRKLLAARDLANTREFMSTLPKPHGIEEEEIEVGSPPRQIGPFTLESLLGRGGMGAVWQARYTDHRLQRPVALKLPTLRHDGTSQVRERFSRERDLLAKLEHPNIARLYDAGIDVDGQPFLALELVQGEAIDTYCDRLRLSVRQRLELFLQVCAAVEFAHRQFILHRDLKPSNILVDGQGQVKLLDFGVAKLLPPEHEAAAQPNDELTRVAGAAITLAFAAPEQIAADALSTTTDVYSLGVLLYRLLTGASPYAPARETRGALEAAILNDDFRPPSRVALSVEAATARATTDLALRKALTGDLDSLIGKAMKRAPAERYASVANFADDIRAYLANKPIAARPDDALYRLSRLVKRNKALVSLGVVAGLGLSGAGGLALWQSTVAKREAARASQEAGRAAASQRFFMSMFGFADPVRSKSISDKDIAQLNEAVTKAQSEFASDPQTLAMVLTQIAEVFDRLGKPDRVLALQQLRLATLQGMTTVPIDDLIEAKLDVGYAEGDSRDRVTNSRALDTLTNALTHGQANGASAPVLAWGSVLIGEQLRINRRLPEAVQQQKQAIELAKAHLPDPSPRLAWAYKYYGMAIGDAGDAAGAREAFKKVIAIDATTNGRDASDQFQMYVVLAGNDFTDGNFLDAAQSAEQALRFAAERLGESGQLLAAPRRILFNALERAGELKRAAAAYETYLRPALTSPNAAERAEALLTGAVMAMARGDLPDALRKATQARVEADQHPQLDMVSNNIIGEILLRQNDNAGALNVLTRNRAKLSARFGTRNNDYARCAERLGIATMRLGQTEIALQHFAEATTWLQSARRPLHPNRVRAEAYGLLARHAETPEVNPSSLAQQLETMASTLANDRGDRIALVPSLRALAKRLRSGSPLTFAAAFPVLD